MRGQKTSDYEHPAWGIIVFVLALAASQIVNVWVDDHYNAIAQLVRGWIK